MAIGHNKIKKILADKKKKPKNPLRYKSRNDIAAMVGQYLAVQIVFDMIHGKREEESEEE